MNLSLRHPALADCAGRGVRIAIVDSGVHAAHPHVGGVAGGLAIDEALVEREDYVDRLGHGTAVTAAIKEKAPGAELWIVKVFDRELATSTAVLVRAIGWAVERGIPLVNLSLGTANAWHEGTLAAAVDRAREAGTTIVSASRSGGPGWLPGSLPGVVAVEVDWTLGRDEIRIGAEGQAIRLSASGYPRPIPGVSPERNLRGVSFAVANATGFLARAYELASGRSPAMSLAALATATRS